MSVAKPLTKIKWRHGSYNRIAPFLFMIYKSTTNYLNFMQNIIGESRPLKMYSRHSHQRQVPCHKTIVLMSK